MSTPYLLPGRLAPGVLRGPAASLAPSVSDELARVALGHPGGCPESPTLTIFDFDDSGSVTGGNDPIGNRYAEARHALARVARRCRCHEELAAVLHFDSPTAADVPPTAIRRRRAVLDAGLAPPSTGGSSSLGASLEAAYSLAAAHPRHAATLVVLSDFELFDADVPRVLRRFADFPGTVRAVVLRAVPPQVLVDDPRVTVTRVDYASASGAVAHAVFGGLTALRPGRSPLGGSA